MGSFLSTPGGEGTWLHNPGSSCLGSTVYLKTPTRSPYPNYLKIYVSQYTHLVPSPHSRYLNHVYLTGKLTVSCLTIMQKSVQGASDRRFEETKAPWNWSHPLFHIQIYFYTYMHTYMCMYAHTHTHARARDILRGKLLMLGLRRKDADVCVSAPHRSIRLSDPIG